MGRLHHVAPAAALRARAAEPAGVLVGMGRGGRRSGQHALLNTELALNFERRAQVDYCVGVALARLLRAHSLILQ